MNEKPKEVSGLLLPVHRVGLREPYDMESLMGTTLSRGV